MQNHGHRGLTVKLHLNVPLTRGLVPVTPELGGSAVLISFSTFLSSQREQQPREGEFPASAPASPLLPRVLAALYHHCTSSQASRSASSVAAHKVAGQVVK